jgi:hypothetical protein
MRCGYEMARPPPMTAPDDLAPPPASTSPPQAAVVPPPAPRQDLRPHLALGAVLAFVATLVIPPLFGGAALFLGWTVYKQSEGELQRRAKWLMVASIACTGIGLAVSLYAQEAGLLGL